MEGDRRRQGLAIRVHGSFRIDDVPEGDYVLGVSFSKNAAGTLSGYRFSVPAVEDGRAAERLELGTLTLEKK